MIGLFDYMDRPWRNSAPLVVGVKVTPSALFEALARMAGNGSGGVGRR